MSEYNLLEGNKKADKAKADQFAELLNKHSLIEREYKKMGEMICKNRELHEYMWKDRTGEYTAVMSLPDEHLKNIVKAFKEGRLDIDEDKRYLLMEEIAIRDLNTEEFLLPY